MRLNRTDKRHPLLKTLVQGEKMKRFHWRVIRMRVKLWWACRGPAPF